MRHIHKKVRKIGIQRLCTSLMIGLFGIFIAAGFSFADSVSCGDTITTNATLDNDLDCSGHSGSAALRLEEGATLVLNGYQLIGNQDINCIDIRGDGVNVWRGSVTQCDYGIRIRSNLSRIDSVDVSDSANRGIRIDGDWNQVMNCSVARSGRQGIKIDEGNRNKVTSSRIFENCRDGIEIQEGHDNLVLYNQVLDNGNEDTCIAFGEDYKPWFYAGIDILSDSEKNKIKYNHACGNLGCNGTDDNPCPARERNFWDENVDDNGLSVSTNEWESNSVCPERTPNPRAQPSVSTLGSLGADLP